MHKPKVEVREQG